MTLVPVTLAVFALGLLVTTLLAAIRRGAFPVEVAAKASASLLLVALALGRWDPEDPFATRMLAGLALCALGDLLLLGERSFPAGLVAFLLGHLGYLAAFASRSPLSEWSPLPLAPLLAVAAGVGLWLWPHLGRLRAPVVLYIVAINAMTWGAVATVMAHAVRWTAAPGAVLFLLSDLAVARQRFVRRAFVNRAAGLPAYYLGQLLLVMAI